MDLSPLAADGWYEPPPPRWPEGYRVPEQFAPQMQPSPQVTDAPAPQFPEPARRGFGDMLAEAVAAAGPMPVDRNASGGSQFLQGLVGGGLGGFAQRRIDAMKGREAVQASLAERQRLRNAEAVTQNTERRAQILAEGKERKAEEKRLTAEQAGYIEVPPNVARLAGRPDLAGKRVSKAQADALGGAARIALDERQAGAKAAGDAPATNPRIQTLDLRLDQMRRKREAIDRAINASDWAALKKLGVPTFRAAQAKVAQLDADMQKAEADRALADFTPGEIMMARDYIRSRSLPGRNAKLNARIAEAAAIIDPEADIAGNAADYTANRSSLTTLRRGSDSVEAFEKTALANAERLLELIDHIPESGMVPLNKVLRGGAVALGDPHVNDFLAQVAITAPEFAKILGGGSIGGAALTDSARHDIKAIMDGSATRQQIRNIVALLKRDAQNRREGYGSTIEGVRDRLHGRSDTPSEDPNPDDFWEEDN